MLTSNNELLPITVRHTVDARHAKFQSPGKIVWHQRRQYAQ